MTATLRNWAGNYEYSTSKLHYPTTLEQVQAIVRQTSQLRVLGTRHSFNDLADSTENLLAFEHFAPDIQLNPTQRQVTMTANMRYGDVCQPLQQAGLALPNLGSLPHISVIGACMTGTHGSGDHNQNLSSAVAALEMVTANGDLIALQRGDAHFAGAVVSLGALGVVVRLTLDVIPAFQMRQYVYEHLPVAEMEANFDTMMGNAYSVSLFTDWQGDTLKQVWLKQKIEDTPPAEFFGATPATRQMHPIAELSGEPCTQQLGIAGAWYERLPHFRLDHIPSVGNELQSEYFVPRHYALDALRAVRQLHAAIAPHLFISEIRSIAADDLWLSPCYQRDAIAIHFTWKPEWPAVRELLPKIEAQLAPFEARPHWGKLFTLSGAQLQAMYPKMTHFQELVQAYDPQGKFRNRFLEAVII